ncbi:hypothetical protein JCM3770_006815 [Rhodotorula araucariae]
MSSVGAFASAPPHVWRRPHRVALMLLATLVLLTLSALEIGGPAALSEPHSSVDEQSALARGDGVMGGDDRAGEPQAMQAMQLGAAELPVAVVEPAELFAPDVADEVAQDDTKAVPAEPAQVEAERVRTGAVDQTLPVCKRSVLFRFAGLHGFGSEVSLLLRVAAVASHFGYALFLDSASWNYGAWDDYFLPLNTPFPPFRPSDAPAQQCRIPPPTVKRFKMALRPDELRDTVSPATTAPFIPSWTGRNHLVWFARDMDGLDATFLRLFADADELAALHHDDLATLARGDAKPVFLGPEETLPAEHERGFAHLSRMAKSAWRPNNHVSEMVDALERRLALPVRQSHGAKRPGDLLVGVHVRLGDKFLETDRIGPIALASKVTAVNPPSANAPGLHDDLVTSYFAAAIDSIHSLLSLPSITSHLSPAHVSDRTQALLSLSAAWSSSDTREKPTLALMSDDDDAVAAFRRHPLARRFRIVGTAEVPGPPAHKLVVEDDGSQVDAEDGQELPVDEDDELVPDNARLQRRRRSTHRSKPEPRVRERTSLPVHVAAHRKGKNPAHARGRGRGGESEIPAGFNELAFNSLPLASRVASARVFVRDLTVLAQRSDALVITGSSNVGRLMMLLFEASRAEGERRELRSLDTRWFPTARFT